MFFRIGHNGHNPGLSPVPGDPAATDPREDQQTPLTELEDPRRHPVDAPAQQVRSLLVSQVTLRSAEDIQDLTLRAVDGGLNEVPGLQAGASDVPPTRTRIKVVTAISSRLGPSIR